MGLWSEDRSKRVATLLLMIREPKFTSAMGWQRWSTPHLGSAAQPQAAAPHGAFLNVNPDAVRRALLAEEQRQVFALLSRLRQARRDGP